jgi:signal transduction histidine kinase
MMTDGHPGQASVAEVVAPQTRPTPAQPRGRPLVLIVEDDPVMATFMRESLNERCQVEVAYDGTDGLNAARAKQPDVIISDLRMPGLSGEELLAAVRATPELDGVPVVLVTGSNDTETRVRLLRAGAHDYLVKPLSFAELQVRVCNLASMKRARDVLRNALDSPSSELDVLAMEAVARKEDLQRALDSVRQVEEQRQALLAREQAARAQAEAAVNSRDEFLSVAAHELKTPVTSLQGYSQLLLLQRAEGVAELPGVERALCAIDRQSRRLTRLINNLLELTRLDNGSSCLTLEPTDLAPLLNEAAENMRAISSRHNIVAEVATPLFVLGDRLRLEQVFVNLLDNALKFSPAGGKVELRGWPEAGKVHVSIRDHGLGIPPEHLPRIFDRLHQAHASSHASGLGLGLYICRDLVQRHGGQIDVTCPPDGGTVVRVAFDAAAVVTAEGLS